MFKSLVSIGKLFVSPTQKVIYNLPKVSFSAPTKKAQTPQEAEPSARFPVPPSRPQYSPEEEMADIDFPSELYLQFYGKAEYLSNS